MHSASWSSVSRPDGPKTLISQFLYPRLGPGMMWEQTAQLIEAHGSRVQLRAEVEKIFWQPGRITGIVAGGVHYAAEQYVSSMPIRDFLQRMDPPPPEKLRNAATTFHYRDFITVILIVQGRIIEFNQLTNNKID